MNDGIGDERRRTDSEVDMLEGRRELPVEQGAGLGGHRMARPALDPCDRGRAVNLEEELPSPIIGAEMDFRRVWNAGLRANAGDVVVHRGGEAVLQVEKAVGAATNGVARALLGEQREVKSGGRAVGEGSCVVSNGEREVVRE